MNTSQYADSASVQGRSNQAQLSGQGVRSGEDKFKERYPHIAKVMDIAISSSVAYVKLTEVNFAAGKTKDQYKQTIYSNLEHNNISVIEEAIKLEKEGKQKENLTDVQVGNQGQKGWKESLLNILNNTKRNFQNTPAQFKLHERVIEVIPSINIKRYIEVFGEEINLRNSQFKVRFEEIYSNFFFEIEEITKKSKYPNTVIPLTKELLDYMRLDLSFLDKKYDTNDEKLDLLEKVLGKLEEEGKRAQDKIRPDRKKAVTSMIFIIEQLQEKLRNGEQSQSVSGDNGISASTSGGLVIVRPNLNFIVLGLVQQAAKMMTTLHFQQQKWRISKDQ